MPQMERVASPALIIDFSYSIMMDLVKFHTIGDPLDRILLPLDSNMRKPRPKNIMIIHDCMEFVRRHGSFSVTACGEAGKPL